MPGRLPHRRAGRTREPATGAGRWPRFSEVAVEAGFRSALALPLRLRDTTIGALNLVSAEETPMDEADVLVARAFADLAAISVMQQRAAAESQRVNEQLQHALTSRIVIEQAKGVVFERAGVDMAEAFSRLRTYARSHNLRLTDVAQAAIDGSLDPDGVGGADRRPALVDEPLAALPVRRAQLELLELAGRGARERVAELDLGRALEVREPGPAVLDDLVPRSSVAPGATTTSAITVSPHFSCGDADHRDLGHRRVREDAVLDLDRRDVLAAGDDHVLLAVGDREVVLVVDEAAVAGVEPAVADRLGGLVGLLPVARHHDVARGEHFAFGVDRQAHARATARRRGRAAARARPA